MKRFTLFLALIVGLLTSASTLQAQVNMNRYITLTVTNGAAIKLDFKAAASATPVRIVSGSNTQDITVGTDWTGFANYTAGSTTMTIYGDITRFDCSGNYRNLTALDVSQNTQLEYLYCYGNNLTTSALDDIFCALPDRTDKSNGVIQPVYGDTSSNHAIVLATNKANAIAKNWNVQYYKNNSDIPATSGTYTCPQPNMSRYITLTVADVAAIKLDLKAAAAGTPVRIVSGSNMRNITVGNGWIGTATYTADGTTMIVYGDITSFDCSGNEANLTALDPSHNTQLKYLNCSANSLTALDPSHNTQLEGLYCYFNQLSRLDISNNTELTMLACNDNKFTTAALNDIYCALPDRTGTTNGVIQPVYSDTSSNNAIVLATNKANAIDKNWRVQYSSNDTDIPTTGSYICPVTDIVGSTAEPALTLYPNPVADVLYLSATARTVRIYNVYGTEVAHAADTDRVEVSHLPAGIYTVKADGTVAKMVKR